MSAPAAVEFQQLSTTLLKEHPLMRAASYDVARVASRVARSVSYVYDRLKLLSLTKRAQTLFREGVITAGHAVILARLTPAAQERAIGKPDDGESPLLKREHTLWNPDGKHDDEDDETFRPISVKELQAWVDEHVRFDVEGADPMLFPETVEAVKGAREEALKIVPITHESFTRPEAKDGSTRTYTPVSWKRADGGVGSKTCERSVQGVIVVGPGRGESFLVCIDKKRCAVHWGEQRAAKRRTAAAAKGGKTGEDRWRIEQRKEAEERAREQAAKARWLKGVPKMLEALAARIKSTPVAATGDLAKVVMDSVRYHAWGPGTLRLAAVVALLPLGKTAEDLVRHMAFVLLAERAQQYDAHTDFPKVAKQFGVDALKILAEVAPEPKADPPAKPAKKRAAPKPAKKQRSRARGAKK